MGKAGAMQRISWTEPFTARERLTIRLDVKRKDTAAFFRDDGLWRRIAFTLPDKIVFWCFIRVMCKAWVATDKAPDEITYSDACRIWREKSS